MNEEQLADFHRVTFEAIERGDPDPRTGTLYSQTTHEATLPDLLRAVADHLDWLQNTNAGTANIVVMDAVFTHMQSGDWRAVLYFLFPKEAA